MKGETMSDWDEKAKNDAVQSGKGPGEFGSKFISGGYKKPDIDPILAHKFPHTFNNKKHKRNKKVNKDTLKATWYIIYVIIFLLVVLLWANK